MKSLAILIGMLVVSGLVVYGLYENVKGNEDIIEEKDGFMTFFVEPEEKPTACELANRANLHRVKQFNYDEEDEEEERLRKKVTRNWHAYIDGEDYWTYGVPASECFSWKLVSKLFGGAIASTGSTGFGIGWMGQPYSLSARLESDFFYVIGQDGATHLGDAHSGSIIKYLNENNVHEQYYSHAYAITEYQLFGDPSLKIGGYKSLFFLL